MKHTKIVPADNKVDMRRGIGHIGISVVAVVHDGKGKILLQKRGPKARDERDHWDICGGALEFGELIEDALMRELQEELCTQPINLEFLNVFDAHREHQGKQTHWIAIVYAARVDPKKVKIGEPHKMTELGWFTEATLPKPLHSQFPKVLVYAKEAGIIRLL
jgi:ADP-ribose pyrophosphatase YjhB (NUDIX family)